MVNKMLIDATHEEETRVVVLRGERVEEFDLESATRKQLRGNIYLAKVTRVEPSLQAAFVDYGGNRHGFLAFSEIHPDYYQIPVADRQALLEEAAREAAEADEADERSNARGRSRSRNTSKSEASEPDDEASSEDENGHAAEASDSDENPADSEDTSDEAENGDSTPKSVASSEGMGRVRKSRRRGRGRSRNDDADDSNGNGNGNGVADDDDVEMVGAEDALEEVPDRRPARRKTYKIQEVIKRRQILLVQVVKEERGTKGAALTTYLSLAGRYCVLMPNTARGGGISRKITNHADRKRLKAIATEMDVPQGMGVIVRTAGANRTKVEIRRDYDYLIRLWETIRELTLKSSAPALIYEEGSLIKRSIRDLYNKDISEVVVEGDEAYKEAKAFMKMLMPSHAKFVKQYKDPRSLFTRFRVEAQLDQMFSPDVTLPSGGYLVINQTEALVAIDVNSGKSTREHNIEDTAYRTNLEAAAEVARQLRLRDLAGLVVIDFIDMEEKRNNRNVERKLKESLKTDRARIQVGRISHFGLMEMSRQRIRSSVIEGTMDTCAHCEGIGRVRSVGSTALQIMRAVEEQAQSGSGRNLNVRTSIEIALYMLNQKRANLNEIEQRFGIEIIIAVDGGQLGSSFALERGAVNEQARTGAAVQIDSAYGGETADEATEVLAEEVGSAEQPDVVTGDAEGDGEREDGSRRKRRRRRRGRRRQNGEGELSSESQSRESSDGAKADNADADGSADEAAAQTDPDTDTASETSDDRSESDDAPRKTGRRRGRRGGRKSRDTETSPEVAASDENAGEVAVEAPSGADASTDAEPPAAPEPMAASADEETEAEPVKKPRARRRRAKAEPAAENAADSGSEDAGQTVAAPAEATSADGQSDGAAHGDTGRNGSKPPVPGAAAEAPQDRGSKTAAANDDKELVGDAEPPAPRRRGWWQRRLGN